MTYLPTDLAHPTLFPLAGGADLATSITMIEERWRVHCPVITYRQLDKRTTPATAPMAGGQLTGEAGASKFDPMWGESVDPASTTWVQPHGTGGTVKAAHVEVYLPDEPVHAQVARIDDSTEMKKHGLDSSDKHIGGLIVTIPSSMLDAVGVTCRPGDIIVYAGDEYLVTRPKQQGYWFNTNTALYVRLVCERHRHGA